MKAIFPRATVLAAAKRAVAHWQAKFDERKTLWITSTALRTYKPGMFSTPRSIGLALAEERFNSNGDGLENRLPYAGGGFLWRETWCLGQAASLLKRASIKGAAQVILSGDELDVLRPVMEVNA
jgi:hypothetical protein